MRVCVVCKARSFREGLVERNLLQVVSGISFVAARRFLLLLLVCEATTRKKAQHLVFLEVPRAGIYFLGISHGSEHVVLVTFNLDPCDSCRKTRRVCLFGFSLKL